MKLNNFITPKTTQTHSKYNRLYYKLICLYTKWHEVDEQRIKSARKQSKECCH